ncbi:MAG: hypothetical protein EBR86_00715 [Planctomycetia bacterium]|nr:hypothetical protein [Planctomycetia bacterium]
MPRRRRARRRRRTGSRPPCRARPHPCRPPVARATPPRRACAWRPRRGPCVLRRGAGCDRAPSPCPRRLTAAPRAGPRPAPAQGC